MARTMTAMTTAMVASLTARSAFAASASVMSATSRQPLKAGLETAHAAALLRHRDDHAGDVDRVGLLTAATRLAPVTGGGGAGDDPSAVRGFEYPVPAVLQHVWLGTDLRFSTHG